MLTNVQGDENMLGESVIYRVRTSGRGSKVMPTDYFHKLGFLPKIQQVHSPSSPTSTSSPVSETSFLSPNSSFATTTSPSGGSFIVSTDKKRKNSRASRIKAFHRRKSFPPGGSAGKHPRNSTFEERMARIGMYITEVEGDGNCLYRAVAHQFFMDESRHMEIREMVYKHMQKHRDRFQPFIDGDFEQYLEMLRTVRI